MNFFTTAEGVVLLALQRLAAKYPFHAALLERFTIGARGDIETAAVSAHGDRSVHLWYNIAFVQSISLDELVGVLLHECHHVLFGHLSEVPENYPDRWARTVAEEVTANEFISEPLPGSPVTLADFPKLPPLESTSERYRRLEKVTLLKRWPLSPLVLGLSGSGHGGQVIDNHDSWNPDGLPTTEIARIVREVLQSAVDAASPGTISGPIRSELMTREVGNIPGNSEEVVPRCGVGGVSWQHVLRRNLGRMLSREVSFFVPSRRAPEQLGIVPGVARRAARPRVLAVVDTSGSISSRELTAIDAELFRISRKFCVVVCECDTSIHRVYRWRPLKAVMGLGGTDFRAPLRPQFLRKQRADVVVYFTDGMGPAPSRPPHVPVIWCLIPGGKRPANWGRVVAMRGPELQSSRPKSSLFGTLPRVLGTEIAGCGT